MSIYNISGVALHCIYNRAGSEVNAAFDSNGNAVDFDHYSIENVVSYYRQETQSIKNEINALGEDWQTVIHITDTHGVGNKQNSQAIGLYLLANTTAKMIVLGGDYSANDWSLAEYNQYMTPFFESDYIDNIYAVFGNHEAFSDSSRNQSMPQIYQDFMTGKNVVGIPENLYFYFDDVNKKTRFMFINTSETHQYNLSDTQIEWIAANAILPSAEWSIVVFGHENIIEQSISNYNIWIVGQGTPSQTDVNKKRHIMIQNAIMASNGHVVGYFCGHQHIDLVSYKTIDDRKLYEATLMCDRFENSYYYSDNPELYPETDRVAATSSEQALSVISFNTKTKNVIIRRIGAGRNKTMAFQYS